MVVGPRVPKAPRPEPSPALLDVYTALPIASKKGSAAAAARKNRANAQESDDITDDGQGGGHRPVTAENGPRAGLVRAARPFLVAALDKKVVMSEPAPPPLP